MSTKRAPYTPEPLRLVKLRLPVSLIRTVDRLIAGSGGAYLDRNEFVAEALRDRIEEELATGAQLHVPGKGAETAQAVTEKLAGSAEGPPASSLQHVLQWGDWRRAASVPTVPRTPARGENFGLHNRDLPTLWALDQLASLSSDQEGPVPWRDYVTVLVQRAGSAANRLRALDATTEGALPAAIGFPKPGAKASASSERFIAAYVGRAGARTEGAFFVLGLAGVAGSGDALAPTSDGITLLASLLDVGLGRALPHPAEAFTHWWTYLGQAAPDEHAAWLKILRVVEGEPQRAELVREFPEWPGSRADTNCMGFISRSREWGLIEPELVEGRYRLTDLGLGALQPSREVATA